MTQTPEWALKQIEKARESKDTHLDLSLRLPGLEFLPVEVKELDWLQSMSIMFNNIHKLPKWLNKLYLKRIVVLGNPLEDAADLNSLVIEYSRYKALQLKPEQVVGLQLEDIQDLEEVSETMPDLKELYLDRLDLMKCPQTLRVFKKLDVLSLAENDLDQLPAFFSNFKDLEYLNLWSNRIESIPKSLYQLQKLESLNLSYNQITEIPEDFIKAHPQLKQLDLSGSPLQEPPLEVAEEGINAIREYYAQKREQGAGVMREARTLIVGDAGSGKTTLSNRLRDPAFRPDPKQPSTHGILVHQHPFKMNDGSTFKTHLWDFGGQEVQYATHQFFLSPRALYVLVCDERRQSTNYDYWFDGITTFGRNDQGELSPVLVILNKRDEVKGHKFDAIHYQERYPNLTCLEVDFAEDDTTNFDHLQATLEKLLAKLPHIGQELPALWPKIRGLLGKRTEENHIHLDAYQNLCNQQGLTERSYQNQLLRYLHDLGIVLHFTSPLSLANRVFLNPRWVLDAAYAVLRDEAIRSNGGRFTKESLFAQWHEMDYSDSECNNLLELLKREAFEICYEIPTQPNTFIVPALLPDTQPKNLIRHAQHCLAFRYHYPFLPRGLFSRLIVRLHELLVQDLTWKTGATIEANGASGLMEVDRNTDGGHIIQIRCFGPAPACEALVRRFRSEMDSIHQRIKGLIVNPQVPLPEHPEIAVDHRYLINLRNQGETEFNWPLPGGTVYKGSISKLLNGLDIQMKDGGPTVNVKIENNPSFHNENKPVITVNNSPNISVESSQEQKNDQTTQVTVNFTQTIGRLSGDLAEASDALKEEAPEIAQEMEDIADSLDDAAEDLGEEPEAKEAKKGLRGVMSKARKMIEAFQDPESSAGKAMATLKDGKALLESMGVNYNTLAEMAKLPLLVG